MRLRLSPKVPYDLEEIMDYIARDSARYAGQVVRLLRRRCAEIAKEPTLYRLRLEIGADVRMAAVDKYVILFRIQKNSVRIERIMHGSRDLSGVLEETEGKNDA